MQRYQNMSLNNKFKSVIPKNIITKIRLFYILLKFFGFCS